jgi:hypothetical protein
MQEMLKKERSRRLRKILKTEYDNKNKTASIEALAVSVLRYSFGIVNCRLEEIQNRQEN